MGTIRDFRQQFAVGLECMLSLHDFVVKVSVRSRPRQRHKTGSRYSVLSFTAFYYQCADSYASKSVKTYGAEEVVADLEMKV